MSDALRDRLQTSLGTAYTLDRELGGGGMSRVFVARDEALGRAVVVKVLPPETAAAVSIERFRREIQLAARLQHPHIVPLLSAGEMDGVPYFTMPFVDGESLRVRLARRGELPVAEAVRVLREVASALAYAHERGVVHRDIKPDNVLLSGGAAMVTDFGVAKALSASSNGEHGGMTSLGVALGTPAYMAPEQASADPAVDHRADVYAFGVLAYELLTGQTPFGGRTPQGLLAAHVTEPPEPVQKRRPTLPPALAALVMRCLEKRPADRPQTAAEILHALDDLSTPSGGMAPTSAVPATAAARPSSSGLPVRSRRVLGVGVALVAVAAVTAAAVLARGLGGGKAGAAKTPAATARSIAVLPLENVGGDTAVQFFADGMTDELTTTVAKLPGVHVASRSATMAAVGAGAADARAAGQRLGVAAVLEGRIRRAGGRMRLTVQLTNVADGLALWAETYDREVKDAFAVQDEVARAIAGALRVTLGDAAAGAERSLASRRTANPEAHDLYLRGRYLQGKYTEPDLRRSIVLFQEALAKDSAYAAAWAGISDSWGMLADDYIRAREAIPALREAIARGLAIDSSVPELYWSRGWYRFYYERDFAAAQQDVERALRADPTFGTASGSVSYPALLWTIGRRDSAYAYLRHAVEREPTNPEVLGHAIRAAASFGDTVLALAYCRRATEIHVEERYCAALSSMAGGDPVPMERVYRDAVARGDGPRVMSRRIALARFLARIGRAAEVRSLADSIVRARASGPYIDEARVASMYAQLGDVDATLEWLERSLDSNGAGIAFLYLLTNGTPLQGHPRIVAFGRRVGLPDPPPYWTAAAGRR